MSAAPIKIGVIGAGNNTRVRHIPGLQAIDGVEIISICNRSRESSQRVADACGIPQVYDTWHDLIASTDINAVMIGTWPYTHRDMTCASLEAGKHVMCEARMAMNAAEAHSMLQASQAHPTQVAQIVPSPLTFKVDATIRSMIDDGYIGQLISLKVNGGVPAFSNPDGDLHWRHQTALSGFNIMNMGIWYEASMRWVGAAARVFARTRIVTPEMHGGDGGTADVPDYVEITTDLENGALATYNFSAVSGLAPGPGAWIYGTKGTLHYDHNSATLYGGQTGDSSLQAIDIPANQIGAWRVEAEFVGAIRGEEEIRLTDFATGVKYMEFTEAVHLSAMTGDSIPLPLANV